MKRKEIDRRITQLLDRIDGELAEIRDGLIEVDHRAGKAAADVLAVQSFAAQANRYGIATREMVLNMQETLRLSDNGDHSRRV